jgi:hypothetical protein
MRVAIYSRFSTDKQTEKHARSLAETCAMKKKCMPLIGLGLLVVIEGCAAHYAPDRVNHAYGFFFGMWHGMILPFALMGKLVSWLLSLVGVSFLDSVTVFGKPNTGFFYYCGFVFGVGLLGGGGSQTR